jgi:hypothetical protein
LSPLDYAATVALLAIYAIGTSLDEGPKTSLDFYRSAATVIPTLLVAVAIQGRVLELSSKLTSCSPRFQASITLRTISTFSCDIAYSRSPAASRASSRSLMLSIRTTDLPRKVHAWLTTRYLFRPIPVVND